MDSSLIEDIEELLQKIMPKNENYLNMLNNCKNNKSKQEFNKLQKENENLETEFKKLYHKLCENIKKENTMRIEIIEINKNEKKYDILYNHGSKLENKLRDLWNEMGNYESKTEPIFENINDNLKYIWDIFQSNWQNWQTSDLIAWIQWKGLIKDQKAAYELNDS